MSTELRRLRYGALRLCGECMPRMSAVSRCGCSTMAGQGRWRKRFCGTTRKLEGLASTTPSYPGMSAARSWNGSRNSRHLVGPGRPIVRVILYPPIVSAGYHDPHAERKNKASEQGPAHQGPGGGHRARLGVGGGLRRCDATDHELPRGRE